MKKAHIQDSVSSGGKYTNVCILKLLLIFIPSLLENKLLLVIKKKYRFLA